MIVLYPGYSFEGLASDRTETEAGELLAAWGAVFHPALVEKYDVLPRWESASTPPYEVAKYPVVVPPCCESYLTEDWVRQQEEGGACLVRGLSARSGIVAALLDHAGLRDHGFDDEYVADFQALATTYLLTELLVRQLHYMSSMDDSQCMTQVFCSLRAYREESFETARDHLRQALDAVSQSKEYFYPIETYLLDLFLMTPKTFGEPFRRMLRKRTQTNLFLSSRLLDALPEKEPEAFKLLRDAATEGKVDFIFDDTEEKSLLLLPILDIADRILEGISIYRERLNVSPTVYGRLHAGLNPILPQLLKLIGVTGAVHFAPLDGWRIKEDVQSKIIWQGVDGTNLDALVRYPFMGKSDRDFFALATQMSDTVNNDQAPTSVFAQFPGSLDGLDGNWLEDLRRMERLSSGLGSFSSIGSYFESTPRCGGVQRYGFGRYPDTGTGNPLSTAVQAGENDPISSWNAVHRESVRRLVRSAFGTVRALLDRDRPDLAGQEDDDPVRSFAGTILAGSSKDPESRGIFLANPWSFPRRVFLDVSDWEGLPAESETVVLARRAEGRKEMIVDIPPVGYAFLRLADTDTSKTSQRPKGMFGRLTAGLLGRDGTEPNLIEKTEDDAGKNAKRAVYLLRNEFFEAKIDCATGMLRSVFTSRSRFNRLSRQIGFRYPKARRQEDPRVESDPNRGYATMLADEITVEQAGPITGRLRIRGRLIGPEGEPAATFEETVTIRRRSRILEFDLALDPVAMPDASPWDSYYAVRYAWNDNTLDLRGGLGDGLHALSSKRVLAPKLVDLREGTVSLTFFTEGLPFHRRFGERQLDTILIAGNESARKFRFGIGIDVRQPVPASLEFLADPGELQAELSGNPKFPSAWLFQVEAKNVIALHWEPIFDQDGNDVTGPPIGFKVFLLETGGARARFALHCFRGPKQAHAAEIGPGRLKSFPVEGDRVLLDMRGHELLPLAVYFIEPTE